MTPSSRAPVFVRMATLLYRALLVFHPSDFRSRSGAESTALFAEACEEDWRRHGWRAMSRRLLSALMTVPRAGLAHRHESRGTIDQGRRDLGLGPDIRQALRSIRRRPGLSATVVATLSIGIGVHVAIFSVIDATVLRPLPFVNAGRVVEIRASSSGSNSDYPTQAWLRTWTTASASIERIEARTTRLALLTGAGPATRERTLSGTPGYLAAIGTRPIRGRLFSAADAIPGAPPVAVVTSGIWRDRFGARDDIVGQPLLLDSVRYTIVGVVDRIESDAPNVGFRIATALAADSPETVRAFAWLRPGVTLDAARAELAVAPRIRVDASRDTGPILEPMGNIFETIPVFRTIELGLAAAAVFVLVIAGVNTANLLLSAGQTRADEFVLRRVLGASPWRLARLLLIETSALALLGAVAGLGLAWTIVHAFTALNAGPQLQGRLESIRLDPVVIGYTMAVACATALIFGLAPAIRTGRGAAAVQGTGTRSTSRMRRGPAVLVTIETALSVVLLVTAGVVGHAFISMRFAPRGFDSRRIIGLHIELPASAYPTAANRSGFFDRLLADLRQLPGVERATIGYGAAPPTDLVLSGRDITVGASAADPNKSDARLSFVEPDYFGLMGIPSLLGVTFATADARGDGLLPAVVSRSFAQRFWPDGSPLGAIVHVASATHPRVLRVIGVVGDVKVFGLDSPTCGDCDPQVYLPLPVERRNTDLLVRVSAGAPFPIAALQSAIARIDPDVPSDDELMTGEESLASFIRLPRFTAALFAAFAGVAVTLVGLGLFAVVSHAAARRTREMGVRLALGATPASVRRLVAGQGLRPAAVGLVLGLAGALAVTRSMGALLYGLSPADPVTFVATPAVLLMIVLAAVTVPAIRATRVDPARTLKAD